MENFYDFNPNFWLPNSSDFNPMGYFAEDIVENDTNYSACNTRTELVVEIKEEFNDLASDTLRNAYTNFQSRFEVEAA